MTALVRYFLAVLALYLLELCTRPGEDS